MDSGRSGLRWLALSLILLGTPGVTHGQILFIEKSICPVGPFKPPRKHMGEGQLRLGSNRDPADKMEFKGGKRRTSVPSDFKDK